MKIAILGSTGGTGLRLVQQALDANHQVTAVVRDPKKMSITHENLKIEKGNIFSEDNLAEIFKDQEAVMSCLGIVENTVPWRKLTFYEDTIKPIIGGMRKAGVTRFIGLTSAGARADSHNPLSWKLMRPFFTRGFLNSMVAMEDYLVSDCQDINFTVLKPPGLSDSPLSDSEVLAVEGEIVPGRGMAAMPRANVAAYMLQCLINQLWEKKLVALSIAKKK